ncbi:MAG TPA: hypothetical protein VLH94_03795 [Spirochaetia bacterium]|nr:hypothetical protein [Spirochaetia bacterium]
MKSEQLQPVPVETFLYPRNFKEKIPFVNSECEFQPSGWAKIEDKFYPLGYKIVTTELKSLGLRNNPNIMTFPIGEWVRLPDDQVTVGNTHWSGWGGIWMALRRGSIPTYRNYMMEKYQIKTRAFLTAMDRPLFANNDRVKSQGVMLLEEIL